MYTGPYVYITDQNHSYADPDAPIGGPVAGQQRGQRSARARWLGTGAIILPGAVIGRNVVVAAGAVVRGKIPDRCVVAGVPARVVREHIPGVGWTQARDLACEALATSARPRSPPRPPHPPPEPPPPRTFSLAGESGVPTDCVWYFWRGVRGRCDGVEGPARPVGKVSQSRVSGHLHPAVGNQTPTTMIIGRTDGPVAAGEYGANGTRSSGPDPQHPDFSVNTTEKSG